MAKIVLAPIVTDIRGKLGSLVFSAWKSGVNYVRTVTGVIKNPQSIQQGIKRAVVASLSKTWRATLSQVERDGWDAYALTEPGKGPSDGGINNMIRGNSGKMTGFNAYILANTQLNSAVLGFVDIAPIATPAPTAPINVDVTVLAGTATVTWIAPALAEVGAVCRIYGRIEGIRGHVQLITTEAFDTLTKDITAIRSANGVDLLLAALVGKTLHVQMDTVNPTGGKSAGSNVASAVIV
ncbi:hypothetical protein ES708_26092 [subsurface metagenome]